MSEDESTPSTEYDKSNLPPPGEIHWEPPPPEIADITGKGVISKFASITLGKSDIVLYAPQEVGNVLHSLWLAIRGKETWDDKYKNTLILRTRIVVSSLGFRVTSFVCLLATFVLLTLVTSGAVSYKSQGASNTFDILASLLGIEVLLRLVAACPQSLSHVTQNLRNLIDVSLVAIFTVLLIMDLSISTDIRVASFVFLTLRFVPLFQVLKDGTKPGSSMHALVSGFITLTHSGFTWSVIILWVIVSYIFAAIGTIELHSNDPRHWNGVLTAMCTLLRITTNSGSSSFMYTSTYGCDEYPNPDGGPVSCNDPKASPFVGSMILILYQILSRYILLNLLVAIVILEFCRKIRKKDLCKNYRGESLTKTDRDDKIEEVHEQHRHRELMAILNRLETKLDQQGKLLIQERIWAEQI